MSKPLLLFALMVLSVISIGIGASDIDFMELLEVGSISNQIILISRVPRTISIIVSGFGMTICGLIMQQITMNKFVSPTTSGSSDGSKLGVILAMLLFPTSGVVTKMVMGIIFSIIVTTIFIKIINSLKTHEAIIVPLIGLLLGAVVSSVSTFLAYRSDLIQSLTGFLFGNFSGVMSGNYELLYISIPLIVLAFLYAKKFTIVGLGKEFTTNLGISYKSVVNIGLLIVCIVSSIIIVTVGAIPFLGLVIPNIVSIIWGDNLSKNILTTGLFGSVFLLICDIVGRIVIYPYEIPIGMIVGVIGSGIFLAMLLKPHRGRFKHKKHSKSIESI